jgi:hypothetical protein
MKDNTKRFVAIVVVSFALMMPLNVAFADSENMASEDSESFEKLSAEWWQWALSIPTSVNPLLDMDGTNAVVGQRGPVWFLAGGFSGGTFTRKCSVPEDKTLYFPVINSVNIDTPNVCGQGPGRIPVKDLRATSAAFIEGAVNLSVTVDGIAPKNLRRVKSEVFEVALPKDNLFEVPCTGAGLGDVPAGIYSPAVDDGFYVLLKPLDSGEHALHFHAENPSQGFKLDVTYELIVVPVLLK